MRKVLILLGAARYPANRDLSLAAFAPSHAAFRVAMTGGTEPIIAEKDVLDLFDTDALWSQQQLTINDWLKEKSPKLGEPCALLIYYVGHGGIADDGSQFFMAINSTNDFDPLGSSISRDSFSRTLAKAARLFRKYLIIDCCFAANVLRGMMGPQHDKMTVELKEVDKHLLKDDSSGLAAICSSDSISTSNALGRNDLTQFTDALLDAIRKGDPDGKEELTFENLRDLVEVRLKALYGERAVPPSSRFGDDVQGPIHRFALLPNRAERRSVGATAAPTHVPIIANKDRKLFEAIRKATNELDLVFVTHAKVGVPPKKLQQLARPIAIAGRALTNLAILDELLDATGSGRDAAVFAAAVVIYERREYDYFDRMLTIAAESKGLRGAPMWRVVRAIKLLCTKVELTPDRRQALIAALKNCARNYDTKMRNRFETRDIVLLVAQTAVLGRLKVDIERDHIFSAEQLADWARFKAGRERHGQASLI